jgi:hypothetical protein
VESGSAGSLKFPYQRVRYGTSKKSGCPKYIDLEFNPGRAKTAAKWNGEQAVSAFPGFALLGQLLPF